MRSQVEDVHAIKKNGVFTKLYFENSHEKSKTEKQYFSLEDFGWKQ